MRCKMLSVLRAKLSLKYHNSARSLGRSGDSDQEAAFSGWPDPVWYLPAPHHVQLASAIRPTPVWYLPAAHHVQSLSLVSPDAETSQFLRSFLVQECIWTAVLFLVQECIWTTVLRIPSWQSWGAKCCQCSVQSCLWNVSTLQDRSTGVIIVTRKPRSQTDLTLFGTCQPRTMCSWPRPPNPRQSDTCQPHTMHSRSPWANLTQAMSVSFELSSARINPCIPSWQSWGANSRYRWEQSSHINTTTKHNNSRFTE